MATLLLSAFMAGCNFSSSGGGDEPGATTPGLAGTTTVEEAPFQLCFNDSVCTVRAPDPAVPTPFLYTEGTRPVVNPTTLEAFPALGWVVGTTDNATIPTFIWQGNRLFGQDRGVLFQVTEVTAIREHEDRTEIELATDYLADPTPARLTLRRLRSGALEVHLEPPPGMREAGIVATLFSIESPPDEGLFGLGARKDFFNQRGKLRNVWTEQQNTGLGSLDDLDFAGTGSPLNLPTSGELAELGINPDVDDTLLAEERTSFPNGAQAAYWVEAFLVGSRGWAAWTEQPHFQRLDLAATQPDKVRWQVVDSDEVTLLFADGGIEEASRAYTAYWGRAPAPPRHFLQPWLDTLNEGEGEAAPNGQGFWGGERARCDMLDFITKSERYDIPFKVIGVEGWQVVPQGHPDIQTHSNEEICAQVPQDEASYAADDAHFDDGENAAGETFFDWVRKDRGFRIAGYWNFFHTDPQCPDPDYPETSCEDSPNVPKDSKLAYYEARDNGYYVTNRATGEDHQVITNRQGISNILDFTDGAVLGFWQAQLTRMFDLGIDLFMHDFGELTTEEMAFAREGSLQEIHNLYAFEYQRAANEAIAGYVEARGDTLPADFQPYFYARAGMTGACSHTPSVFPGDESTSWDKGHGLPSVVPAMLNLSLSGCYLFTTDIGGYFDFTAPRTTEDLFIRWSQLAALTPVMRIHSSTFNGSVYPWTWEEGDHEDPPRYDTTGIFRRYARLKRHLIPLVAEWADRAAHEGAIGPVRPIILEDTSERAMAVDYQWLLGDDILVAPVIEEDAHEREVYFPAGARWLRVTVDAHGRFDSTGDVYSGGATDIVALEASLSDIPIFLRCGGRMRHVPANANLDCP